MFLEKQVKKEQNLLLEVRKEKEKKGKRNKKRFIIFFFKGSMSGCCRALRSRIDNVLKGNLDVFLSHELRSLVQFYRVTLNAFIEDQCPLSLLLNECQQQFKGLFDSLVSNVAQEAQNVQTVHPGKGIFYYY